MCISNNAYDEPRVTFADTILYGARVKNAQGGIEHVLAYYNKVSAGSGTVTSTAHASDDFGWDIQPPKGNAMLFAVPLKPGSKFGKDNLIALKDYPQFMEDYKTAFAPRAKGLTRGMDMPQAASFGVELEVVKGFDGGVYDVVIAPNASSIATVIDKIDEDKRPEINVALYKELDTVYPDFAFVLFCFSESDAEKAGCAAVRYEPLRDDIIFLPGLDGHNGAIERGRVNLNHTLIVSTFDMHSDVGTEVYFHDLELPFTTADVVQHPKKPPYWMLTRVIGQIIEEDLSAPQGDFLFKVSEVKSGEFRFRRQVPPGWSKLTDKPADPAGSTPWYYPQSSRSERRGLR